MTVTWSKHHAWWWWEVPAGLLAYVRVNVSKMFADGKEEFVAEDLLESAVEFTNSRHFRNAIADFIETNEHTFRSTAESKDPDANELPHEYNKLFMVYQQLVDELFESLAQEKGFTTKALYRCFRDAADNKFTALFEENEYKWFVDKVMSWMDFHEFLNMMHTAALDRKHGVHK